MLASQTGGSYFATRLTSFAFSLLPALVNRPQNFSELR